MKPVIGCAPAFVEVYRVIERVADTNCNILITGPSGSGKELVARASHQSSRRASQPFVAVNCGAIPEALLESELFGHAKGAFTGAHASRSGRIAQAEGGTLFLDELGELPLALQVKLLRVLQTREYSPVGDSRTFKADVRVVAATNVDLEQAVRMGTFREDLYYRLNVIHVQVPSLQQRAQDIGLLAEHFLQDARCRMGRERVRCLSAEALEVLRTYHWPGNVRELENTIERAVLLCTGDRIEPRDLPARLCGLAGQTHAGSWPESSTVDLRRAVEAYENQLILRALKRANWNKKKAAEMLGINRTTLVEMLKRKRLSREVA